ncbi:hypothetical protein [Duganella sp. Root198D2]|uniref:hypothetical protein n=1 Tax=Duganella sp. Root198D2 TaxID=1736489 RepID=UPI000ACD1E40|nr:hypothetical protein [Duganella sp. Root198D2]
MKLGAKTGVGKAALALCAGLCCTLMAGAHAQSDQRGRQQERREAPRDFRDNRMNDAREARYPRQYEGRMDDAPRMVDDRDNADSRRTGRMTPDERRDLRRQINEAGQQVYSLPRRR